MNNEMFGEIYIHDTEIGTVYRFEKENEDPVIDMLLDQYNDYMTLYKMFDDENYLKAANDVMALLNE